MTTRYWSVDVNPASPGCTMAFGTNWIAPALRECGFYVVTPVTALRPGLWQWPTILLLAGSEKTLTLWLLSEGSSSVTLNEIGYDVYVGY
jgi:hypothetical protein